jgi:hypothetical protein
MQTLLLLVQSFAPMLIPLLMLALGLAMRCRGKK